MQQISTTRVHFQDKIPYDIQMGYIHFRPKHVVGVSYTYTAIGTFIFLIGANPLCYSKGKGKGKSKGKVIPLQARCGPEGG